MTRDSDDDALRWEGDEDPTLAPGWKAVGGPAQLGHANDATPTPTAPEGHHEAGGAAVDRSEHSSPAQTGSAELVLLGVLGGVYLLYAIGWLFAALADLPLLADPVAQFMYGLGRWFAVAAAPLWFGAALWLTAGRHRARLIWLIAGALLLVPVPFLLRG